MTGPKRSRDNRRWAALVALMVAACRGPSAPTDAQRADGLYLQGTAHYLQGDFARALAEFEEVRSLRPTDARLPAAMGEAQLALGRIQEAVSAFEEATRQDQGRSTSWSRLGFALALLGRAAEAKAALERAVALNPDDALALEQLGDFALADGNVEGGILLLVRAAQASVTDAERTRRHLKAAQELGSRGKLGQAVDVLQGAVAGGDRSKAVWTELGDLYVRWGRLSDAEAAYREGAMQKDPTLWITVGEIALAQGRIEDAQDAFREAWVLEPTARVQVALGRLALRQKDRAAAEHALAEALARATGTEAAESRELAELLLELGHPQEALSLLAALAEEEEGATDGALQSKVAALARRLGNHPTLAAACQRLHALDGGSLACRPR